MGNIQEKSCVNITGWKCMEPSDKLDSECIDSDDDTFILKKNESRITITNLDSNAIKSNDVIIKEFERSVFNKDFVNAMALIEEYKNVNLFEHKFKNGDTCLHYSVRLHNAKFLYFLLQKNIDPNIKNEITGDTALHIATQYSDQRMIITLLKYKADCYIENILGKTPVDVANKIGNEEIICCFETEFQLFLNANQPTVHYYEAAKPAKFGRNNGASALMMSAFDFDHKKGTSIIVRNPGNLFAIPARKVMPISSNEYNDDRPGLNKQISFDDPIALHGFKKSYRPSIDSTRDVINEDYDIDDETPKSNKTNASQFSDLNLLLPNDTIKSMDYNNNRPSMRLSDQLSIGMIQRYSERPSTRIALQAMKSIEIIQKQLPTLKDWLQKLKMNCYPKIYQKRYLFVRDGHLCWNTKRIKFNENDIITAKERKKYDGCISLLMIKDVNIYKSKKKNTYKFEIISHNINFGGKKKNKDIKYLWKCYSNEQRTKWVSGLKQHCNELNIIFND